MDSMRTAWSRFEKSGKIDDYMAFCEERRRIRGLPSPPSEEGCGKCEPEPRDQSSV